MKDALKALGSLVGIIILMVVILLGIKSCAERDLDPWCRAKGYDHGTYSTGYNGGSFCIKANGEMIRVEGP